MSADHVRCETEIARLQDAVDRITASSLANATRYAADLAAARGITERLRAGITAGGTDAVQAHAIARAYETLSDVAHGGRRTPDEASIAAALLALNERHKAALARLAKIADLAYLLGARDAT